MGATSEAKLAAAEERLANQATLIRRLADEVAALQRKVTDLEDECAYTASHLLDAQIEAGRLAQRIAPLAAEALRPMGGGDS